MAIITNPPYTHDTAKKEAERLNKYDSEKGVNRHGRWVAKPFCQKKGEEFTTNGEWSVAFSLE